MLTFLNVLVFALLLAYLVTMIIKKNDNVAVKHQAYICIAIMVVETISLVIRCVTSQPWFILLAILVVQVIVGYEVIVEAQRQGVFKRKKKQVVNEQDIVV